MRTNNNITFIIKLQMTLNYKLLTATQNKTLITFQIALNNGSALFKSYEILFLKENAYIVFFTINSIKTSNLCLSICELLRVFMKGKFDATKITKSNYLPFTLII